MLPAMKVLLDTHALLWMDADPARLSATARSLILDPSNVLHISAASQSSDMQEKFSRIE